MKSREKVDTVRGVDEHENFKSKQWEDKNGNPCYNFWDILVIQDTILMIIMFELQKILISNMSWTSLELHIVDQELLLVLKKNLCSSKYGNKRKRMSSRVIRPGLIVLKNKNQL